MPGVPFSLPTLPAAPLRVTPTDVSQFVRLEQCERFLRLRLSERARHDFMEEYGVGVQRVTPLMSLSGSNFEEAVEAKLAGGFRSVHYTRKYGGSHRRPANNQDVVAEARGLNPGQTVLLFQARLEVELGDWLLRGDVDLIKLARSADGNLDVLIADMKSTAEVKVEHRLQVAFYHLMLAALFDAGRVATASRRTAILFRPPVDPTPEEEDEVAPLRAAARAEFGLDDVLLELVADQEAYVRSAHDLVLGPESTARRVASAGLGALPYALSFKCDGCLYTEFCMKWSAEAEDLSLLPYLTSTEKEALRRGGVATVESLATLKQFPPDDRPGLVPSPGREAQVRQLATTWPVGPRLDELVHRARMFRRSVKKDGSAALAFIPDRGNSSLPVSRPDLNPNLVWLYLDAQHDPLEGRLYLLGALAVASKDGVPVARRAVVRLTDGPPRSTAAERELFVTWTRDLLRAVAEIAQPAGPADDGAKRAPIHIVFFDRYEQQLMLEGLARNFPAMLERTPPLYDFLTQLAAFDSPVASFLDQEVRTFRNYPMICQSLQSLASYLKFDWNTPLPFRELFRARLFDYLGKLDIDGATEWYTRRARFASTIPAEYAYAAWGQLPKPARGQGDEFADFRPVTKDLLVAFQTRRLEALEHVASRIPGNPNTQKTSFALPEIARYDDKSHDLAHALDEFVRIERLVSLGQWKGTRHAQPEQRVLMGECLLVRYYEEDQDARVAGQNRENERRRRLREEYVAAFRQKHPDKPVRLPKDQIEECKWSPEGLRLRLRVETAGVDCDLNELLLLSTLREGAQVIVFPRWTADERLPEPERKPFTPTPKQMLYGQRAELVRVRATEKDGSGRVTAAVAEVELQASHGSEHTTPYVFGAFNRPLIDDQLYTLDPCPDEWYAYWCAKVIEGLCEGSPNVLYDRLVTPPPPGDGGGSAIMGGALQQPLPPAPSPLRGGGEKAKGTPRPGAVPADLCLSSPSPLRGGGRGEGAPCGSPEPVGLPPGDAGGSAGQQAFLAGLDAFHRARLLHDFEPGKREFIGGHAATPILMVQGPPGTGKSYSTAFAVFARIQGAMRAGHDYRAFLSCKTHAATDVLLGNVLGAQQTLGKLRQKDQKLFDAHFDKRLLTVPLYRVAPRDPPPDGVIALAKDREKQKGAEANADAIQEHPWAVVGITPGGTYGMLKKKWPKAVFGQELCDLLVLDEASQMNLPEALMAALPLKAGAPVVVVGDHRQMPPIVKHDWESEARRTFRQYEAYRSLFDTLRLRDPAPPMIRFEESFRLHGAMAEFLRREVYRHDGIAYHSKNTSLLARHDHDDDFTAAVLHPDYPLVVVVHDECASQVRNPFEQNLIGPVLLALADATRYGLDPTEGLGVVVPHRAQRAALQQAFPELSIIDPNTELPEHSAVDTVERFQGGERTVVLVSATESDRGYLLASAGFLLDPRRLTVAISRAKQKMILVASRSVFTLFSPDEETFNNALLWKNLLAQTCVDALWHGAREGIPVTVWGGR